MREIVLYGAGLAGEKFYCLYKRKFNIRYVIDRNCKRFFHGIRVYSLKEKEAVLKEYLIIIATETENVYYEIAKQLENLELKEFENYIPGGVVDKELAILYGNCHMIKLENYLLNQPEFSRRYYIRRYYVADLDTNKRFPNEYELKYCGLLISQDIQKNNSFFVPGIEEIEKKTLKHCKCIRIPNLYGLNFLFPQVKEFNKDVLKYHINKNAIDIDDNLAKSTYIENAICWVTRWEDENINKSCGEVNDIQNMIENAEIYCKEEIIHNFQIQIDKLRKREKKCDINISDFIEKNYKEKQLFYDPNHPTNEVIYEKGRKVMEILNLDRIENRIFDDEMDQGEIFIYGCVRKALKLNYKQKYIRRCQNKCTLHRCALSLHDYIEEYIMWHIIDTE